MPLARLLELLEELKADKLATPTVAVARDRDPQLSKFTPVELRKKLAAVQEIIGTSFIEVSSESGEVRLQATAAQITTEVERHIRDLFHGIDATDHPPQI